MLTDILIGVLAFFVFLFIFWRRLKEDYASGIIFTSAFYLLLGLLVGYASAYFAWPAFWFWSVLVGLMLGLGASFLRFHLKFYETLEAAVIGFFIWLSLIFLADSVKHSSVFSFIGFIVLVLIIGLFYFLEGRFRNFSWYKSGRIGFCGLTTLGVFFLIRSVVCLFYPFVLSFVGKKDIVVSSLVAFTLFLLTFNLSRKKI
jgi:hypothetical protein